jgi:chromosome segregation ATPase
MNLTDILKISSIQKENSALQRELESVGNANAELKKMLEQKEIEMENAIDEMKQNVELMANERDKEKVLQFSSIIQNSKSTISNLEQEIYNLKNQIKDFKEEAIIYKSNTENVNKQFIVERETLNGQISNAKEELKRYENELTVLKNKESQYNNMISTKDGFIKQLEDQLQNQIAQFQYIEANYKNNLAESEIKIGQLSSQYNSLYSSASQKYNEDIGQSNFEKANVENEVLNLKNIIENLKNTNAQYEVTMKELSYNNSKLSIEIQNLTSQHTLSQSMINELKHYSNELGSKYQTQLDFLNSNKDMADHNYNQSMLSYTNMITNLQNEIANLKIENTRLSEIILNLNKSLIEKNNMLNDKIEELKKLTREINEYQDKINNILFDFTDIHKSLYKICKEVAEYSGQNYEESFGKSLYDEGGSYSVANFMQGKHGFVSLLSFLTKSFTYFSRSIIDFSLKEKLDQTQIKKQQEESIELKKRYETLEITLNEYKNQNISSIQESSFKNNELIDEIQKLKEEAHKDQQMFNSKINEEQKRNVQLMRENQDLLANITAMKNQISDYILRIQMFEKDAVRASNISSNFASISKNTIIQDKRSLKKQKVRWSQ